MTYTAEQFTATSKANLETLKGLTTQAYGGFEKLVELNLAASKALLGETFSHTQAVLGAKDAQQVLELQAGVYQPLTEKSVAYGRHVYAIAADTGAEFAKAIEAELAKTQQAFTALVENVAKNAPAGSESAVAVFKTALNAGQNAIESAQSSAKKAVEAAETNFTALANQAVTAAGNVAKKA